RSLIPRRPSGAGGCRDRRAPRRSRFGAKRVPAGSEADVPRMMRKRNGVVPISAPGTTATYLVTSCESGLVAQAELWAYASVGGKMSSLQRPILARGPDRNWLAQRRHAWR